MYFRLYWPGRFGTWGVPKRIPRPRATGYPSDVTDEEWALVVPYLTLSRLDSPQRTYDLRTVFNAIRWLVRTGASWRMMPNDLPPWPAVYQQWQRWVRAGCFEALVHDLRVVLRIKAGHDAHPTAMILDSRTLQSTPESGARAGYDGAKRRKGAKVHAAVDTLGHLLALHVTPADAHGLRLEVIKHTEAKRGFILLPRRWVVERSFAWAPRFRRLTRDYERLAETLAAYHYLAFACLMLPHALAGQLHNRL